MDNPDICPECGNTMTRKNIIKGSYRTKRVDRLTCSCGFCVSVESKLIEQMRDLRQQDINSIEELSRHKQNY